MEDGSFHIPDYKTSKLSGSQDKLFPLYEAQLNAYAWIHEGGFGHVSEIDLIYCSPQTDLSDLEESEGFYHGGFRMKFEGTIVPVEIKPDLIPGLFKRAKSILDMDRPPAGVAGCKDCTAMENLLAVCGRE